MDKETLRDILKSHCEWQNGKKGKQAVLKGEDLTGMDIHQVFREVGTNSPVLKNVDFREAILDGAQIDSFCYWECDFSKSSMIGAGLYLADLRHTKFVGSNLTNANLGVAELDYADLREANLAGANLAGAYINHTDFRGANLKGIKGVESIKITGNCLGIDYINEELEEIKEVEKEGYGLTIGDVRITRSKLEKWKTDLDSNSRYPNCFISYSSKDQDFVDKLYNDLKKAGVSCWYDSNDLNVGDKLRTVIDEAIKKNEKVLLVLSENSIESDWVGIEVEKAFRKEKELGVVVLFPIRIDDSVMSSDQDWAFHIRKQRHIGDFSNWKSLDRYNSKLSRILRDLIQAKN
jgi:uncharacterized protein YjbI with pentapeptide repeats